MLNLHHKTVFKYHLTRILEDTEMREDQQQTFIANVLSKASQVSTNEAKDYMGSIVDQGHLEDEIAIKIARLLDKYTTHR